jgi:hypothetical protein
LAAVVNDSPDATLNGLSVRLQYYSSTGQPGPVRSSVSTLGRAAAAVAAPRGPATALTAGYPPRFGLLPTQLGLNLPPGAAARNRHHDRRRRRWPPSYRRHQQSLAAVEPAERGCRGRPIPLQRPHRSNLRRVRRAGPPWRHTGGRTPAPQACRLPLAPGHVQPQPWSNHGWSRNALARAPPSPWERRSTSP